MASLEEFLAEELKGDKGAKEKFVIETMPVKPGNWTIVDRETIERWAKTYSERGNCNPPGIEKVNFYRIVTQNGTPKPEEINICDYAPKKEEKAEGTEKYIKGLKH